MAAVRCGRDATGLEKVQRAYGISMEEKQSMTEKWSEISRESRITEFEKQIDEMFDSNSAEEEEKQQILEVIQEWETEYKKNCGL